MRGNAKATRLEACKHDTASKIIYALLTGLHPKMRFGGDALLKLIAEVREALDGRDLPDPWRIALNELEDSLQKNIRPDESLLAHIIAQAGLDAVVVHHRMTETPTAPTSAPVYAREYVRYCALQHIAAIGNQIYNAAREVDIERLVDLADGLAVSLEYTATTVEKPALQPETPAQLRARAGDDPTWLWDKIIPAHHLVLLAGREKGRGGKSTLLFGLIAHMLKGEPFMGRTTQPQRILYLSEEGRHTVRQKLNGFNIHDDGNLLLMTREAFPGGTRGAVHRYRREIERIIKRNRIDLMIVDTMQAFADLRGDAENHSGPILEFLQPLSAFVSEGIGVLIVHHHAKESGEPRGNTALTGGVDVILNIHRKGGEHAQSRRVLEWEGRYGNGAIEYEFNPEAYEYTCHGTPEQAELHALQQQVLAVLSQSPEPLDTQQVADALEVKTTRQRVNEALLSLLQAGKVQRTGEGKRGNPFRYFVSAYTPPPDRRNESDTSNPVDSASATDGVSGSESSEFVSAVAGGYISAETAETFDGRFEALLRHLADDELAQLSETDLAAARRLWQTARARGFPAIHGLDAGGEAWLSRLRQVVGTPALDELLRALDGRGVRA